MEFAGTASGGIQYTSNANSRLRNLHTSVFNTIVDNAVEKGGGIFVSDS
jgi:hypothetical protein